MGLFGGKDDTKSKIEELRAKMQQGAQPPSQGWQPPQQPWQQPSPQQQYQPPQQSWQPPREEHRPEPPREERRPEQPRREIEFTYGDEESQGIVIDLGDGMSLNLPVKSHMRLDEFLRIADRVRELKKIEHPRNY